MDIVTLGAALNGAKKQTENYVGSHFKGGSNIQITNNPDGTQTISASGEVSAEDTVAREAIAEHVLDKANPHEVTATQVGLGNVNNTSDIDKPVSTAMQTALDAKANTADVYSKNEVDTALGSKQNVITDLADIRSGAALGSTAVQPVSGKGLSTNDYTTAEKEKLAAIEAQANKTVVDDTLSDSSTNPVQNKVVQALAARLVDAGSKNLLKITGTSQTIRNVTFTVNDDGTVSVDGTNNTSSSAVFYLDILSADTASNYNGCILTGCPQGGSTSTYRLALQLNSGSFTSYASDIGNGATIHDVPSSDCRVVITVYPGATVNNLIFKPMICTAEDYAISPEFVPYAMSNQELTKETETNKNNISKDEAAIAELVDSGQKNHLLNGETSRTISGVTFTIMTDKTVALSGTATSNITSFRLVTMQPAPEGNMVLSGCPSGGAYNKYKLDILNGGTSGDVLAADYGNGVLIDWSLCTTGYYTARIRIESGQNVDGLIFKPMLCTKAAWDISQAYAPYRPSYDELVTRIEALEQATGINSVRSMANLTTETVADATETEGGEAR